MVPKKSNSEIHSRLYFYWYKGEKYLDIKKRGKNTLTWKLCGTSVESDLLGWKLLRQDPSSPK